MQTRRQAGQGFLFVLPALAFLIVFLVYPTIWTVALSFAASWPWSSKMRSRT